MKKALVAVTLIVALGAVAAFAHGRGHGGMDARIQQMEDFIQATPQQRQVIDQAKEDIVAGLKQQQPGNLHQQFLSQLTADKVDVDALNKLVDDHAARAKQVIIPNLVKIHDALTPAQRQKLADHVQQMQKRHQQPQGGFGGPQE